MVHQERHGFLAGCVVIDDECGTHDLQHGMWTASEAQGSRVSVVATEAKFVLLVEKRSIFDRLTEDKFQLTNPCILATGNGYPGSRFYAVLRDLHQQLHLPFYVLADNDPAGYLLYFFIARGEVRSDRRARADAGIADALYLGLRAADAQELAETARIDLSQNEVEELARLKSCSWLRSDEAWQREIDRMTSNGFKVELEALCSLGISFLSETYLPQKLSASQCLRWNGA